MARCHPKKPAKRSRLASPHGTNPKWGSECSVVCRWGWVRHAHCAQARPKFLQCLVELLGQRRFGKATLVAPTTYKSAGDSPPRVDQIGQTPVYAARLFCGPYSGFHRDGGKLTLRDARFCVGAPRPMPNGFPAQNHTQRRLHPRRCINDSQPVAKRPNPTPGNPFPRISSCSWRRRS